ncbi:hypothetical protein [Streptomyces pyxinae]|uniref:hypothetical protein n=1 Tax=Streptomyces pyxinae TaxID=2970734 RepID=UPI002867E58F|nr:hypothetical protein [Streptomyces sp. LP05-1]
MPAAQFLAGAVAERQAREARRQMLPGEAGAEGAGATPWAAPGVRRAGQGDDPAAAPGSASSRASGFVPPA